MGWLTWRRAVRIWCGSAVSVFAFFSLVKLGRGFPETGWMQGLGYSAGIACMVIFAIFCAISQSWMTEKMFGGKWD